MSSREMFGARLRHERERRGISLDAIARATKVSRSLFEGLERDDVSRWPCGIFRRSFLREYATAIGVPAEPLLDEFLRLFPEPGATPAARLGFEAPDTALRLTLVHEFQLKRVALRVLAAVLDVAVVLLIALASARLAGAGAWTAAAVVALSYYTLSTLVLGRSIADWALSRVGAAPGRRARPVPAEGAAQPLRQWIPPARPQPEEVSMPAVDDDARLVRSA